MVRPLQRAGGGARQAIHRLGRFRPAARRIRHRRLARARAHAARGGDSLRCRPQCDRTRTGADPRRDSRRQLCVVGRSRRRAYEHRKPVDRARRGRGQTPAHRALAQRPGGDRRAPLFARGDRRYHRADQSRAARAARLGRPAHGYDHAGLHAHAGCAAGVVRASPDGVFRNARPRRAAARRSCRRKRIRTCPS